MKNLVLICLIVLIVNITNSTGEVFQEDEYEDLDLDWEDEVHNIEKRSAKSGRVIKRRKIKTGKMTNLETFGDVDRREDDIENYPSDTLSKYASVPRQKRFFNLFNWVTFPNTLCDTTDGTTKGICYTESECKKRNGVSKGNCASGYGVCCYIADHKDKAIVDEIVSYFQNEKFPSANDPVAESREFTVSVTNTDVCQIRIDFQTFEFAKQNAMGECEEQNLMIEDVNTNTFCGENENQHVYLHIDSHPHTVDLEVSISAPLEGATGVPYKHNLMITQVDCNTNDEEMKNIRAPPGCLQYYHTHSGTITSFNYDGVSVYGPSQDYAICIKKSPKNCGIRYTNTPKDSTKLRSVGASKYSTGCAGFGGPGAGAARVGGTEAGCGDEAASGCLDQGTTTKENDWLAIAQGQLLDYTPLSLSGSYKSYFCGQGIGVDLPAAGIAAADTSTNNYVEGRGVRDYSNGPFVIYFHTDDMYTMPAIAADPQTNNLGFVINYAVQNSCRT